MLENLEKYKIILASNSPRRKELLSGLGIKYEVKTLPGIEETYPDTLKAEEIPLYIACEKAAAYRNIMHPDELIITADTIVWLDGNRDKTSEEPDPGPQRKPYRKKGLINIHNRKEVNNIVQKTEFHHNILYCLIIHKVEKNQRDNRSHDSDNKTLDNKRRPDKSVLRSDIFL